ncbi:hypothetical protein LTR84_006412 [Exophiala bonariae]|uniref:Xylanolytic transcriptional activator regulatory domain-containing protein n=1 Tax=Exophiala bonariae TaxID=1690606 RepID=A0AAV9N507_9EURO|nr:hypothetical protein LTR84_006412 [Exophiala bonariae]
MTKDEAIREGFASPGSLSDWHASVAREYSRQSVDSPSIRSIQANLILALRELLTRTSYKAWTFAGVAIRQAQALRLGQEYHKRLGNRQKEVQRRTYWACFIMDRLISHSCWRPQTLDIDCVRLNLPAPENLFTFDEPFEGPKIQTLTFQTEVSRLGLAPYFLAALHLWAQATYVQVKGGRQHHRDHPSIPESDLYHLEKKIEEFCSSVPPSMRWSTQNMRVFHHTGQQGLFVNFHFLINHMRSAMHQEYLPYRDSTNTTATQNGLQDDHDQNAGDFGGWDEKLVSICISSSEAILEIVAELYSDDRSAISPLRSVFAANAMLSAANIQLWIRYVDTKGDAIWAAAAAKVDEISSVFELWRNQWPVADAWSSTLASLRRLYEATYSMNIGSGNESGNLEKNADALPAIIERDDYEQSCLQLIEGNGLPDWNEGISDKIRFLLLASLEDTDARERVLSSSISILKQQSWEYEGFLEDLEHGFSDLGAENSWPGFVDDYV